MISANLAAIFYLASGILFILALRGLSSPDTSRQGNYFGIAGMIIAIVVTFLSTGNFSTSLIYVIIFLVIGGAIGAFIAFKIPMTAMPELVAGFHSLVGLAAVFVAIAAFLNPAAFNLGNIGNIKLASLIEKNTHLLAICWLFIGRFEQTSKCNKFKLKKFQKRHPIV